MIDLLVVQRIGGRFSVESYEYTDNNGPELILTGRTVLNNAEELVEYLFKHPASEVQFVRKRS